MAQNLQEKNTLNSKKRSPSESPDELQCKLNLPRSRLGGGDEARAGNGKPGLIEDRQVLRRRSKVGSVQNVKKFGAELSIESLRNPLHGIVFENREIQI